MEWRYGVIKKVDLILVILLCMEEDGGFNEPTDTAVTREKLANTGTGFCKICLPHLCTIISVYFPSENDFKRKAVLHSKLYQSHEYHPRMDGCVVVGVRPQLTRLYPI